VEAAMAKNYYYGAYPFIAWTMNHYFLAGKHSLWVTAPFYVPATGGVDASPYRVYGDLLRMAKSDTAQANNLRDWRDRLKMRLVDGGCQEDLQPRLLDILERIAIPFFVPIVYRVDIDALPFGLAIEGDSEGQMGLTNYELRNLEETQFDILFADFDEDAIRKLWRSDHNQLTVLEILEGNC
jgi:hypothetical protein